MHILAFDRKNCSQESSPGYHRVQLTVATAAVWSICLALGFSVSRANPPSHPTPTVMQQYKSGFYERGKVNKDMSKLHRIAAGGITFKGNTVLLVRYRYSNNSGTYLVGPGGALEDNENVVQAIIRETKEETGITVKPKRVVAIEDLVSSRFKMIKIWMVCDFIEGEVQKTKEAEKENIIEADWFTKDQLSRAVVFPPTIMQHDWNQLLTEIQEIECLPSRKTSF